MESKTLSRSENTARECCRWECRSMDLEDELLRGEKFVRESSVRGEFCIFVEY